MDKYNTRRIALKALIDQFGWGGQAKVAKQIGKDASYLSRMLSDPRKAGSVNIGEDTCEALEKSFPGWITLAKEDLSYPPTTEPKTYLVAEPTANYSGFFVPVFDVDGSMGKGSQLPASETIVGGIRFDESWLSQKLPNVSAKGNLAIISGRGDSMMPTISDGDLLLIDLGVDVIKMDAIYVVQRHSEVFIKRMQRRPDGVVLMISDNRAYVTFEIALSEVSDFIVLGKVLFAWNGNKL